MKIKYLVISDESPDSGVINKAITQTLFLNLLNVEASLIIINSKDYHYPNFPFITVHSLHAIPSVNVLQRLNQAFLIRKIILKIIESLGSNEILYYRFPSSFPLYYPINYFKTFRNCILITEHQSIDISEFKLIRSYIQYFSELFFGFIIKNQVDAVVGVTDEITKYQVKKTHSKQKPNITMGNGIDVNTIPVRKYQQKPFSELKLLFVANIRSWHGIDRLIRGLKNNPIEGKIVSIHIVGIGEELNNLKKLAQDLGVADHIIFYGFLKGRQLDILFDECHIAIGSLGVHRKGLTQTSELKGREYCARGIPFIIACDDPDFPRDFPYILHFPQDESHIDIKKISNFAEQVYSDPNHPQIMRQYALKHLDWSIKINKLKEFFEIISNRRNHP